MKKFDKFSRFEDGVYYSFLILIPWVFAFGAVYFVSKFFPTNASSIIRYGLWAVCGAVGGGVGMLLDFILGNMAKNVFTWIRKKRGMKPLHEIASEISREQVELEQIRSEQEYARFEGRDDKENLYEIAKQQEKQTQDLTKLTSDVKMVKFILILLVVFYVAYTFLK